MTARPHFIAHFLLLIVFMVAAQCTIGAITRLTESGLSIVEWKPVTGALPPLSDAAWQEEFTNYQTSPQYEQVNKGMALAEFKTIFWWEWVHRFWARLIGIVFALPLAFFWIQKWIPQEYKPRLLALLALGAAQGIMGWAMVASGLIDHPAVSHYRLAAHLALALLIMALAFKWALELYGVHKIMPRKLHAHGVATLCVLCVTIVWGAFVAGLDAGRIYNEFPLMGYSFVPGEAMSMQPWWINFFENHAAVQFIHRWLGVLTGLMAIVFALRGLKALPGGAAFRVVLAFGLVQPLLGIATLISEVSLPLAALHQLGAIGLLLGLVWTLTGAERAASTKRG